MASWGEASESRLIGKRIPRLSGRDKVTGKAKYTFDINRPGMLYGRILRSEIAHANVVGIDLSEAEALPGVKAVIPIIEVGKKIRYQGQEIAAVAAETDDIAKDAIRLIRVDLEELPYVVTEADAMAEGAPQIRDDWEGNQSEPGVREAGDLEGGFAQAAVEVEATYHAPVQTHVCLETHGHVAEWEDDQNLTVWASTQAVFGTRNDLAGTFDLPANQVRVITEHMGGGFGSKFGPGVEGRTAAELSTYDRQRRQTDAHSKSGTPRCWQSSVNDTACPCRCDKRRTTHRLRYERLRHRRYLQWCRFPSTLRLSCAEPAH